MFLNQVELALIIGVTEGIGIEQVRKTLEVIGETGFGRDASTGLENSRLPQRPKLIFFGLAATKRTRVTPLLLRYLNRTRINKHILPPSRGSANMRCLSKSSNHSKTPL